MRFLFVIFVLSFYPLVCFGIGNDHPTSGYLYSSKENNSMTYDCKLLENKELECEFIQTSVRRQSTKDAPQKEIKRAFKEKNLITSEFCKQMSLSLDYLEGKKKIPNKKGLENFANMTDDHKKDMSKMLYKIKNVCQNYTMENFNEMLKTLKDRDQKTCLVNSNKFTQKFIMTSKDTWSIVPEYTGSCQIMRLDRFEKIKSDNYGFWNYVSQKVVTNKNSNKDSFLSCKDLDENEYFYSWKPREIYFRCEYIKFGLF